MVPVVAGLDRLHGDERQLEGPVRSPVERLDLRDHSAVVRAGFDAVIDAVVEVVVRDQNEIGGETVVPRGEGVDVDDFLLRRDDAQARVAEIEQAGRGRLNGVDGFHRRFLRFDDRRGGRFGSAAGGQTEREQQKDREKSFHGGSFLSALF